MRRSTVVMLVLLVLLAGLYWYSQQPDNAFKRALNPGPTSTSSVPGYIVGPVEGPVSRISIQNTAGKTLTFVNSDGSWAMTVDATPVAPNQGVIETVAIQVQSLRIVSKIGTPPPPSATGLDNPAYTFTFTIVDGSDMRVKVGKTTVTGSGYYVEKADGSVVVVDKYSIDELVTLLDNPPYLYTPTPSPLPFTATPTLTVTPAITVTPAVTLTLTPTP